MAHALFNPARMHDISLKLILHEARVRAPDFWEKAVLMDNIVCFLVIADDFASIFKYSASYAFNIVMRLARINKRISIDGESLTYKEVLLNSVLQATLQR